MNQNISKQIEEIEKNQKLDDTEKALLVLALANLTRYKKNIRGIRLKHTAKLELIRKEVAYIKLYKRDLRGLKGLLSEIEEELTTEEIRIVSSSLVDSYRDNHSKALELLGQEDTELKDKEVESQIYKEFYGDTFDSRISANNKLLHNDILLAVEDIETADYDLIDRELEESIANKLERSEVLLDNELMRVFNLATVGAFAVAGVGRVRYSAELDNRTCEECESLEGTVYNINDDDIPDLPLHPRCRCVLIPE